MHGLRDLRVVDFSSRIAGPYATKLLADAGADVIKVEGPQGDPLRRWSASGADLGGEDSALFRFLHHGKRSVIASPGDRAVEELVSVADLVVESFDGGPGDAAGSCPRASELASRLPGLVRLSISPFGRSGPWSERPASEFTLQAESGSIGTRGLPGAEPYQAGGRIGEWLGGTFAAVAALAAVQRARRTGHGEDVDFSLLEVMTIASTNYMDLLYRMLGVEVEGGLPQSVETPSIEPTADGYVGFCTNSRQQFSDFLLLIGRPDLRDDEGLAQVAGRVARLDEWNAIVHDYTTQRETAEIIREASRLRIPVAPICNGDSVRDCEQLKARGVFLRDPTGRFLQPRPPYRIDRVDRIDAADASEGVAAPMPAFRRPAPRPGEHNGRIEPRARSLPDPDGRPALPLAGLRVMDMTAWWAGPSATHMLAALGAEVIHVESVTRPDGMRMVGGMLAGRHEAWWECSPFFLAVNANKRGLTLDLSVPRGIELAKRLVARSDVVVENFTPRVMDHFGLSWAAIHALNPRTILVRMPAFGLSGPWRDHTGFAQTMEQMTGLAWLTGHRDDQPRIQRGPCDPLAGMHASFALLVALAERERTGRGSHVECSMVEGALNAAAEQLVEYTAYGRLLHRDGNRCPEAAPQGLYPCLGSRPGRERWLALSVASDAHWRALAAVLGNPAWTREAALQELPGRRAAHDRIDAALRPWFACRERAALVDELLAAGIPAAPVADPRIASRNPQMAARAFFEPFSHPVVGTQVVPTVPFRYASVERWLRAPAPTLGEHNRELLCGLLGLDEEEFRTLVADGVIGDRPAGL